jgi:hypothetical protein
MLNTDLVKKLSKKYEPSTMVNITYKGNDVAFKTDEQAMRCYVLLVR